VHFIIVDKQAIVKPRKTDFYSHKKENADKRQAAKPKATKYLRQNNIFKQNYIYFAIKHKQ